MSNRDRIINAVHLIEGLENEMLHLLQEFDARELTMDEWQKWKKDPKRDPICKVYHNDYTPIWVLSPNEVNEVLYYTGKIKLFTKKPEKWQVKWEC